MRHKHVTARKCSEFIEAMRLLLRSFLGQYDASRRPNDGDPHVQISTLSASLA